ncbi:MAG: ATP-binding protein [Escherichia coli]|nr:ATP-binding protein [Escherichia coli]
MNVTKMTFRFYDRTKEPADLQAFSRRVEDDASRMVIISGRRRIGRTTLANPAFTNGPPPCLFFHISDEKTAKTNVEAFWRFNAATLGLEYFPPLPQPLPGRSNFCSNKVPKHR